MSEVDLQDCEDCVAPAEAFGVIASEPRLAILEALWDAEDRPVGFSDLRREVGMRDSAQFNYHLGELRDQFVVKTDAGYDLRHAGKKVVRAILAGEFNETPTVEPFPVRGDCADCGGDLRATYADEKLTIECTDCEALHGRYSFPPGGLADRTETEIAAAFDQRVRHLHCLAADGVCPECSGPMETNVDDDGGDRLGLSVVVDHVCGRCDHHLRSSVGLSLLDQSIVVAAHRAHGIDLGTRPYWTLPWCVSDEYTEVRSRDPWRIAVTVPLPGEETPAPAAETKRPVGDGGRPSSTLWEDRRPPETLRVTLDGNLAVVDVEVDPGA